MKAQLQYETYMHLQNVLSFDLTSTSGTYKLSRSFVCFFIILYRRSLFVSFVFFFLLFMIQNPSIFSERIYTILPM